MAKKEKKKKRNQNKIPLFGSSETKNFRPLLAFLSNFPRPDRMCHTSRLRVLGDALQPHYEVRGFGNFLFVSVPLGKEEGKEESIF